VLSLIHAFCRSLQHALCLLSLPCLHQLLSRNNFQSLRSLNFPCSWLHTFAGCCPCHCSSQAELTGFQLMNSQLNSTPLHSLTHSLHYTAFTELNSVSRVIWTQSEPTKNTASNISSTVASRRSHINRMTTPLPTALLSLRDVAADVTCSCCMCNHCYADK
jgi:hypothetical protein